MDGNKRENWEERMKNQDKCKEAIVSGLFLEEGTSTDTLNII